MSHNVHPRIPSATYRLQFHAGFTFDDAREILDYLKALGVSDIYASPYFQASPDSTHGYDVADHNRLNPLIGDDRAFRAYCLALKQRGMGQVLDFVPNHMGIGQSLNLWWVDVLEDGLLSPYACYFDIDWRPAKAVLSNRVLLPILGDRYGKVLEAGEFKLSFGEGGFFLSYYGNKLPIKLSTYGQILERAAQELAADSLENLRACAARFVALPENELRLEAKTAAKAQLNELAQKDGLFAQALDGALRSLEGRPGDSSSFDSLHELLDAQIYRLSYWRSAAEDLNYRRFFDINHLAGLRVEIPEVFDASHRFVFDLLAKGNVSGLRIDHVDGLWEPRGYLQRLQERYSQLHHLPSGAPGLYLVVEKILDLGHEALPDDWPVHGTTGYDFVNQAVQLLVDSAAEKRMTKIFERFTGLRESFADLCYEKKMLTMQISLSSEIAALGNAFVELSEMHRDYRDFSTNMLVAAVREVMASFPVYRTYLAEDAALSSDDERVILRAILAARRRNTSIEKSVLDFLRGVLLLRLPENSSPEQRDAHARFVMKFQQSSGPIMAKGVEDTAFYIYNRLVALNEVGGKPEQFGMSLPEFHRLNSSRAERWPHSMLGTSTHDTKRSEDVRLRIASLSEIPEMWDKAVRRWGKWNAKYRTKVDDESSPSRNEEYLLYQTLVGSWPLEPLRGDERAVYVQRIQAYMIKALKEAKINSSWIEPNEEWEKATINFVGRILDEKAGVKFCADLSEIANLVAQLGALNSLVQTVLKCTVPGVPDFYQGTEIWDFSLVDPDNRRPVDYSKRTHLLDSLSEAQPNQLMMEWRSGRVKLFVTQRLLRFRAENPSLFQEGGYHEVPVVGKRADHIVAFERKRDTQRLLVVVPRLSYTVGLWPIGGAWEGTFLLADAEEGRKWHDVFTQKTVALTGNQHDLPAILSDLPFAVLYQGERSC